MEDKKVVNIETLIINHRRKKNCKCNKPSYEIDIQNHLVYCKKCMAVVEPFEALIQIATHIEDINYSIENAQRYKMEIMSYKPYLREAKRYESMMRQKDMLPICPKCSKPFNWNEVVCLCNKKFIKTEEDYSMENEIKVTFDGEKAVACPVCYGRGFVPAGFYNSTGLTWVSTTTGNETCRSCGGKGYIKL